METVVSALAHQHYLVDTLSAVNLLFGELLNVGQFFFKQVVFEKVAKTDWTPLFVLGSPVVHDKFLL